MIIDLSNAGLKVTNNMEPIYAPHFGEATRKRKMRKAEKRWKLRNEITDDILKFMIIATFLNAMAHSDKILNLLRGLFK